MDSIAREPPPDRRDVVLALGIFALALTLRLYYLYEIRDVPFIRVPLIDAQVYDAWAREIAAGNWWGDAAFYQAPAYPYFLATVYRIFGPDLWAAHQVQMVLGAGSCVLIFLAARSFFDRATGVAAGVLLACYPPAIFFDGLIQKAGLGLFLLSVWLLLIAHFQARPRAAVAAASGWVLGLLALTRENALIFALAIPIWIVLRFRLEPASARLRWVVAFGLGVALVLAPVALRNHSMGGGLALTTSQMGTNFYIGNHAGATGVYAPMVPGELEREGATRRAERALGRNLTPAEVSDYWLGLGIDFVRESPGEWATLLIAKTLMMFNDFEVPDTEDIRAYAEESSLLGGLLRVHHFGVLLPLAVVGMTVAWRRRPDVWIHYWLIAVFTFGVVIFYVVGRYRYPLVPLMLPLAGFGLVEFKRAIAERSWDRVAMLSIVAVMAGLLCNRALFDETPYRAATYANLATILLHDGQLEQAQSQLERAEGFDPRDLEIQFQFAVLRYEQGRLEEAVARLRPVLAGRKGDPRPHRLMSRILREQGRMRESLLHRRKAERLEHEHGDVGEASDSEA